ncbi:hypothetical protein Tco_1554763 [Tanacetum coccineum]
MILCTNLQKYVLDLEKAKDAQAKEIVGLKKRVQKLERKKKSRTTGLQRLRKVGESSRGRIEDAEMFDIDYLHDDEVIVDMAVVTTADEGVTAAKIDEITPTSAPTTITTFKDYRSKAKHKNDFGLTVTLKRKDQVALDNEMARNLEAQLQAELIEEEKMARKKEEEANIALIESWENTQAMIEVDRLLAGRLQTREQEELTDQEKAKLFMEFIERRRKHFAVLRAQEKRNRPPTKAQKRNQMSVYFKHMGGYKHNQLKGRSYDEIQKLFDKDMKRVNSFVAMNSEVQEISRKKDESSSKKTEIAQDSSTKRA